MKLCEIRTDRGQVQYELRRSLRRRTLSIAVNPEGAVRVSAPAFLPDENIQRFIRQKSGWILTKIAEFQKARKALPAAGYADGQEFFFLGKKFPLRVAEKSGHRPGINFNGTAWEACVAPQGQSGELQIRKMLGKWYQEQARELFPGRIFHYARVMKLDPETIAVKTQKRIWGSCNHRSRSINLNWQLVMAPLTVIDYVVVHELAHLVHPNHSRRFWHLVEQVIPDHRARKRWLNASRLAMMLP